MFKKAAAGAAAGAKQAGYWARRRQAKARAMAMGGYSFIHGPVGASLVGMLIGIVIILISLMGVGLDLLPGILLGIGVIILSLGIMFMRILWILLGILILILGIIFFF